MQQLSCWMERSISSVRFSAEKYLPHLWQQQNFSQCRSINLEWSATQEGEMHWNGRSLREYNRAKVRASAHHELESWVKRRGPPCCRNCTAIREFWAKGGKRGLLGEWCALHTALLCLGTTLVVANFGNVTCCVYFWFTPHYHCHSNWLTMIKRWHPRHNT